MWQRLKKWFTRRTPNETGNAGEAGEESAAHPDGDQAPRYHRGKRALKDWHTSHWDLDYMSREEMEDLARKEQEKNS